MRKIPAREAEKIRELRRTGHSLPEIQKILNRGAGTVFRYAHSVDVPPQWLPVLRRKQGGSQARSKLAWEKAGAEASQLVGKLTSREKVLVLAALYWGEGTKSELNIINGDPNLLRVFVNCLQELDVSKNDLQISLRLFEDIRRNAAKAFWAEKLGVKAQAIHVSEVLQGRKKGKFPFGMCRIRLKKSGPYFKLIMSVIESLKSEISPRSSMD